MTYVLGISAFYHDSAAALIKDGVVISAVQEERFTRKKHDASFPSLSIKFLIDSEKISLNKISKIVFYDKPFLKFERLLETYISTAPFSFNSFRMGMPIWLREKLFLKKIIINKIIDIDKTFSTNNLFFSEHHLSHAASAFYPSPFEEAIVLTLDGVGEWATSTVSIGQKDKFEIVKEINFPHSLGLLYSAFTYYTGFKVNSGEYKLMGLAPYGRPVYKNKILDNLIDIKNDGSFRLNQKYFNYLYGLTMINKNFENLFGQKYRNPENEKLTQFHMDIASSIQLVIEEVVIKITNSLLNEYKIENLCLAGGVALNCVSNGRLLKEGKFKNIWIQPASGDAGGSLGAALAYWHIEKGNKKTKSKQDHMQGSFLGPKYERSEIKTNLIKLGAKFQEMSELKVIQKTAKALSQGKAIGWFQGKMEFGPRALGSRSILGDPRSDSMQKTLNLKVKFRESFRPFAPSILREDLENWFELRCDSPYMLLVSQVKKELCFKMTNEDEKLFGIDKLNVKRSKIPAVTHIDYSSRVQTVHEDTNKRYHSLIKEFKRLTGCPILVNTSFNVRGEPIVCSPADAFRCFMGTDLDALVIENFYLEKNMQDIGLYEDYKNKYELD